MDQSEPEAESTDIVCGPRSLQMNLKVHCCPWTPLVLTFGRENTKLDTIMNGRKNSHGSSTVSPAKVCCVNCVGSIYIIIKLHAINQVFGWVSQPCLNMRKDKVLRHSQSETHLAALEKEQLAIIAASDGGIAQALEL